MQFVYLLFQLDSRKLPPYKESEIYLPQRLGGTFQQLRAKANTPPNSDDR